MTDAIRVIHAADLHIGTQNYGRLDAATGLHTRILDFLKSLDSLVDYAIDTDVDIVLLCGDIFKSREPDVTQQREFAKRIKRLSLAGITVYIVIGNHDLHNSAGKATSVEIYDIVALPNIFVRRKPNLDIIHTKRGCIQIAALPYVSSAHLSAEGLTIEDISLDMRRRLDILTDQLTAKLDANLPALLASHYSVIGADSGSERGIMLGREVTIPVSVFQRPEYEYVALGHIHKHQVLGEFPPVVYSGSLDRVDFSEESQHKGFVDVSVKKKATSFSFVKLDTREFKTIYVDATNGNPFEKAVTAIESEEIEDSIVKVKVKLKATGLSGLNESELYKILRQRAFYVAGIEKDIAHDSMHLRHPGITERINAKDALIEYISKKEDYVTIKEVLLHENSLLLDEVYQEAQE